MNHVNGPTPPAHPSPATASGGCDCCQAASPDPQPTPDRRARLLLQLFPRRWQRHYGPEFLALLADQPPTWRDLLDIARSAGDARVRPSAWLPPQAVQMTADEPVSANEPLVVAPGATVTVGGRPRGSGSGHGHGHGHLTGNGSGDPERDRQISRRRFLRNSLVGGAATLAVATGVGVFAYTQPGASDSPFGEPIHVPASDIPTPDGPPLVHADGRFFLVNEDNHLLAMYRRCTHLHCTVDYEPADADSPFACPCHGSMFDIHGVVTAGPAPRPLELMRIERDGVTGDLIVNTGVITVREDYDPAQRFSL